MGKKAKQGLVGKKAKQGLLGQLARKVIEASKDHQDHLDHLDHLELLEHPQTCAPSMPLVKRSHVTRTKQSCLRFAKVAAADRLCRMALFDVLAPAELLDFASENDGYGTYSGLRPGQI